MRKIFANRATNSTKSSNFRKVGLIEFIAITSSALTVLAISLYIQASELEPTNPLPLSNLSAAYFEAGDYDKCIDAAVKCLTLISVDDALYEKVKSRQLQACVYAHQTDAVSHPANYPILAVWTDLLESEASFQYSESNMQDCRQRLFREIPIIKPSLYV